ncbi:hypothetical protein GGR54DRAFT_599830 [Hypoxylon sp. NC1633]|nr:hypothetical protein GGR54DRAFT_599830 [Hypoxylon sp. NC1633]
MGFDSVLSYVAKLRKIVPLRATMGFDSVLSYVVAQLRKIMPPRATMGFDSGIKVLVDPAEHNAGDIRSVAEAVDIVAIHGIGALPDDTWRGWGPDKEEVHWLKDPEMLPRALPNARIMRFGYKSAWYGSKEDKPKKTDVSDVADMLLSALEHHRHDINRPIIFMAHSYGGLVLMQALRRSFDDPDKWSRIFFHTAGLIFFGTPFRGRAGLTLEEIVNAVAWNNPDDKIYRETMALSVEENPYLQDILKRYTETRIRHPIPLCCFYETEPSPIGKTLKSPEVKDGYLVPEAAACLDTSKGVKRQPLERHHYNLQKFSGASDPAYQAVEKEIVEMVNSAREYLAECSNEDRHFMVSFGRNENFVGRESILRQLLKRIPPSAKKDTCQLTALEGLGGIGKTQIALEAAYRVRDEYPDCSVFWVPAVDATSFENAYRHIGRQLGVKRIEDDQADVKMLVKDALSHESAGSWLMIVDNADDLKLFADAALPNHLPFSRKGSILFTTRSHGAAVGLDIPQKDITTITEMNDDEGTKLLRIGLKDHQVCNAESIGRLLEFLAYLPLAIKQASAYLAKTDMSVSKYLHHCQSSDRTMVKLLSKDFEDRNRYKNMNNPVATTWLISFDHISLDYPLAARYLKFICYLAEKDIPVSLLPPGEDELEADEAIGILKGYAFIMERNKPDSFDVHRLVRLAMRNWLQEKEEWKEWATKVFQRLTNEYPDPQHENRGIWMSYLPHGQMVLELRGETAGEETHLLFKVAWSYSMLGKYNEAEQMFRQTLEELELREPVLGKKHPFILANMNNLAGVLERQGKYEEAEQMHRQTLELMEQVLGKEHPGTLANMSNLAGALVRQGKYEEAEQILRQTLELREWVLGTEHPDTLGIQENLDAYLKAKMDEGLWPSGDRTAL